MAGLTGRQIANSYKDLLQLENNNEGIPLSTPITVRDGEGNSTPLQLSQGILNVDGTFRYNGINLTTNVSGLNAAAAGSSLVTGIVAEDGANKYGRTLTASTGITITNETGESGNPTFAIADTSVSAGSYGPMNNIIVNAQGQITSITAATTISANAFIGGTLSGSSLYVENNVSVSGTLDVAGAVSIAGAVHIDGNTTVANLWAEGDINSTGIITAAGPLYAKNVNTSVVSATYLRGDGSGITGLAGAGTMTAVVAGSGITMLVNGVTATDITGSGTVALETNQTFGVVSATSFVIGGDNVAMSATVASLSATMATSIDNSNTLIAAVSALTSVNAAAITSINSVVGTLSATMATSIDNSNTNIAAVSALTSVNAAAITSINTNITAVSAYATSITQALSATMATSIANHLPLAGGTMTGAITLPGNPSANLEAATKQYVDNLTAAAIHFHEPVRVEKEGNLNATYNNGTNGVGATLTNAGTQAALVIDGVTLNTSDRVLVYEQTDQTQNGVYTVTDTGSGSTNWVLTRATDADSYEPGDNDGLDGGSYFYVQEGTAGAGESYVCNNVGTITFGTTNITFVQFSSALVYTAGTGIDINSSRVISTSGVPTDADLTALSATMATSIANVSSTMATSISNHLPLAGGTLTGNLNFGDNDKAQFGAGSDLQIYHDGAASRIVDSGTGNLIIQATDFQVNDSGNNEILMRAIDNGGVELRYSNQIKFATTSTGVDITGNATFDDNGKAIFGAGNDLQIYHDGTGSVINEAGTGNLTVNSNGTTINLTKGFGETLASFNADSDVELYYDNSKKFETTSYGIDISGNATADVHTNTSVDATTTPDFGSYNSFVWTLKGNLTLANPTTEHTGMSGTFVFIQDGTGSRTLSVGNQYKTVGGTITLSTDASAVDVVPYFVQVTGTVLLGSPSLALA